MVILENKSRIPDVYFSLSEDFDYRKYLEEKSHSDEIVLAIDRSTSQIIGGAQQFADRIGQGAEVLSGSFDQVGRTLSEGFGQVTGKLDTIDATLQSGFELVSINLNQIDHSIGDLSNIVELGFEQLTKQAIVANELLGELVTLFKTPEQVWAREQFDNAKVCIERGLWDDALDYINKSIHGDDNRYGGFRIAPEFHFLKGKILLQYPEVGCDQDFLDLALASFQQAIKYCGKEHDGLKAESFLNVSWCYYCFGDFDNALKAISDSLEYSSVYPLADFLRSKYLARLGRAEHARDALKAAIQCDTLLLVRAENDPDFAKSNVDPSEVARQLHGHLLTRFRTFLAQELGIDRLGKLKSLAQRLKLDYSEADESIYSLRRLESQLDLRTLSELFCDPFNKSRELLAGVTRARGTLTRRIKEYALKKKSLPVKNTASGIRRPDSDILEMKKNFVWGLLTMTLISGGLILAYFQLQMGDSLGIDGTFSPVRSVAALLWWLSLPILALVVLAGGLGMIVLLAGLWGDELKYKSGISDAKSRDKKRNEDVRQGHAKADEILEELRKIGA